MDTYEGAFKAVIPTLREHVPLKRIGSESEVAAAIVFLLSPAPPSSAATRSASTAPPARQPRLPAIQGQAGTEPRVQRLPPRLPARRTEGPGGLTCPRSSRNSTSTARDFARNREAMLAAVAGFRELSRRSWTRPPRPGRSSRNAANCCRANAWRCCSTRRAVPRTVLAGRLLLRRQGRHPGRRRIIAGIGYIAGCAAWSAPATARSRAAPSPRPG